MKKNKTAYVVIAHGSRETGANRDFLGLVKRLKARLKGAAWPAFLELAKPLIPEAIDGAVERGAREIVVLPLMFFPGRHARKDIPALIEAAKERHPEVDFHYAGPLGEDPLLIKLLGQKAKRTKS